jgi:hypothetical protein
MLLHPLANDNTIEKLYELYLIEQELRDEQSDVHLACGRRLLTFIDREWRVMELCGRKNKVNQIYKGTNISLAIANLKEC